MVAAAFFFLALPFRAFTFLPLALLTFTLQTRTFFCAALFLRVPRPILIVVIRPARTLVFIRLIFPVI
jgi:hypothetical protein